MWSKAADSKCKPEAAGRCYWVAFLWPVLGTLGTVCLTRAQVACLSLPQPGRALTGDGSVDPCNKGCHKALCGLRRHKEKFAAFGGDSQIKLIIPTP